MEIRAFPKVKNSVVGTKFQMSSKFHFPYGKHISPNSLINHWNLRKWNISFIILSLKCDTSCVNSSFSFQQWNLNLGINFPNSYIDWKLEDLNFGIRLHFPILNKFFRIHKEIENWHFWILYYIILYRWHF